MPHRYEVPAPARTFPLKLAEALRRSLAAGYSGADLRRDALAGIVVGIVALPLSMALAVASGVAPQHGLYTAIVCGGLIALLGGSRVQVSGPTAAFVVILAPISARFGLGGLAVATLLAGVLLVGMGAIRLGSLIQFVPYPVTTGFTAGIAVVIATLQLKDFLGLTVPRMPDAYVEKALALGRALPTWHGPDFAVGAFTLAVLLLWPRVTGRVPAPLVALGLAAAAAALAAHAIPGFAVATIDSRFHYDAGGGLLRSGVPRLPPLPGWPWRLPDAQGHPLVLSFDLLRALAPPAFAIAMLGAIESLLSAVVADGMIGGSHDPDAELVAQGIGNMVGPFFGAIPATGAIARTATNVRSGARSPLAAAFHALFVLASVLALAPLLGYLPMASLAALLLLVAWNMSEARHFLHAVRVAPRSDVVVLLVCFGLTVLFDMVIAVSVGIVLAALLFMRRMAEVSGVKIVEETHPILSGLPSDVLVYEVAGPLFFGAAQKAMSALKRGMPGIKVVILDLSSVPAVDVTGLVSLESAVDRLEAQGVYVILAGVQKQPARALARSGLRRQRDRLAICRALDTAAVLARRRSAGAAR
jgi:sulfate permease, SulP family